MIERLQRDNAIDDYHRPSQPGGASARQDDVMTGSFKRRRAIERAAQKAIEVRLLANTPFLTDAAAIYLGNSHAGDRAASPKSP